MVVLQLVVMAALVLVLLTSKSIDVSNVVIVHVKFKKTQYFSVMEDMEEDGDLQADALTSLEYTSLEGVHMDVISSQVQAQTSVDYSEVYNDNYDNLADLDGVAEEVTNSVTGNDNESPDNIRGLTEDTLLHSESISYDVLCAMAGTNNLGSVRNFTIRLRSNID